MYISILVGLRDSDVEVRVLWWLRTDEGLIDSQYTMSLGSFAKSQCRGMWQRINLLLTRGNRIKIKFGIK
jgi:hypothetical protein